MSDFVLPYPGLRAFARDESHLFFGREGCVDKMIERLAATRFLAVLGASGSGKSSMVRTGLLDGLELGFHAKAGSRWTVVETHPGGAPLRNLAASLAKAGGGGHGPDDVQVMRALLARGPRSLVEWCKSGRLEPGRNLLVLVDQFEELFRYADYAAREEAEAFCALLLESAQAVEVPIHIVLTMRSEYLGACALIPDLAETINSGFYLTPRMTRHECRSAIEGPAAVCGFTIEPALVNTMLNDMAGFAPWEEQDGVRQSQILSRRADQLPLMQHVLNRLWLKANARAGQGPVHLTLKDYEAGGRLTGALDAHGVEILAALGQADRARAAVVLRALVSGPDLANAVRRPCRFSEIASEVPGGGEPARRIVEALRANGCNFLMPPPPTPIEPDTVIDIGHESLIRQWSVMSALLEAEARAGAEWDRLRLAAQRHKDSRGSLLAGADLASTQAWWESDKPSETWALRHGAGFALVSAYLQESLDVQDAQRRDEERREQREQDRLKKQRNLYLLFALTLLPLLIVSATLFYQARGRALALTEQKATVANLLKDSEAQRKTLQVKSDELARSSQEANSAKESLAESNRQLEEKSKAESALLAKVNDQYMASERVNKQLRPYQDYILLSEAMKTAGFVRNPKVSSDVSGIALSGYDPVSYFQGADPSIGSPKYFALHNGAVWLFSSEQNKAKFVAQPERYVPALGGFCTPCLYSAHWYHGRPTAWNIVDGKLYLASTPALAENFRQDPSGYLARAKPNFDESKGIVEQVPNVPTAVGKVLQSYILALNTPDAYTIIQQSAADYAQMQNYYAAASQQREAVALLLNSSDVERRNRDAPKSWLLLSKYRLLSQDYSGAEAAAREGSKFAPGSTDFQAVLATALLFDNARKQDSLDLMTPLLGKYMEESELFWEESMSSELANLPLSDSAKATAKSVLDTTLATSRNCNRFSALAEQDRQKSNWKQASALQEQYANCLQRLPASSKRFARDAAPAFTRWALFSLAAGDYTTMRKAAVDGLKATPNQAGLQAYEIAANIFLGQQIQARNLMEAVSPSGDSGNDSVEATFNDILTILDRLSVKSDDFADTRKYVQKSIEFAKLDNAATASSEARKFNEAIAQQQQALDLLFTFPRGPKVRAAMAESYLGSAWYRLMARQAPAALAAAESGLSIEPDRLSLSLYKAHALLLAGQQDEAEKLYASKRGSKLRNGKTWETQALSDLTALERETGPIPGAARVRTVLQ